MRSISHDAPFWKSRGAIALVVFGAIAAFFMFSEHRAHFLGFLPYMLILACPLMHVFMHHGHASHTHGDARAAEKKGGQDERAN
ncbi:DUF2933 domain-containing protein [Caballeronia sp. LZ008]|uniref:DUF2933 domain-containing protein n=1 Tax=unclassified Caballeronia TaxID=2646786 RepID=UPI0009DB1568|nr:MULTISPECIES: DUF2933 domain-containing protein [unclassified Caballeronia]MDR5794231.1 DUF2933 domain-containing protein [Caballeronia sp. LZ008]